MSRSRLTHRRLKAIAALEGKRLQDVEDEAITQYISRHQQTQTTLRPLRSSSSALRNSNKHTSRITTPLR